MAKMKINFSKHAEGQLKERNLDKSFVSEALAKPDQVIEGKKGRKIAHKITSLKNKEYLLRIVYTEQRDFVEVITAYLTTRIDKYWRE